jgi:Ca-activated chloride channel family protein
MRVALAVVALASGFVALARPQKGMEWETASRKGTDLLFVVDTSRSMDADDLRPSRLERAKLAIRDLVARVPGDRIGLVAFAGDAFVQSPMTLDHGALLETVDALDTNAVARGGTNVGRAIDVASEALASEPSNDKSIVLLTDGEDLEGAGFDAAKRAAAAGITIDAVGIGSTDGQLVPSKDERGRTDGIVRDENGAPVRSRLDESGLRAISEAAHGTYRPLGADGRGLEQLYDQALAARAHEDVAARTHRVWAERFMIPMGVALGALVLEALLGFAVRRRSGTRSRAAALAGAATLGALVVAAPGQALASTGEAQKAYSEGRFEDARRAYEAERTKHPEDAALAFNVGDAAYRAGRFEEAGAAFQNAEQSPDVSLRGKAAYNRGNALYRGGEELLSRPDERAKTIENWKAAIAAYEQVIGQSGGETPDQRTLRDDATFNRDVVRRKLEELEKKPDPSPSPDSKNDDSKGGSKNDDSKGGSKNDDSKGGRSPSRGQAGAQRGQEDAAQAGPMGAPTGQEGAPTDQNGRPQSAAQRASSGNEARLSPSSARALLGAVTGDERHGSQRGADAGPAADEAPRKDW